MLRGITLFLAFLAYTYAQNSAAVYVFDPTGASGVTGEIEFTQSGSGITIKGTVSGLTPGKHGFHIHNLGKIAGGCTATGPHFNPHSLTHGAPEDKIRHAGDLGNIVADNNGLATIEITDSLISFSGATNIIGRAVVVHAGEDDLGKGGNADSLTTGNAGGRVACGVIGILNNSSMATTSLSMLLIPLLVIVKSFWSKSVNCN